MVTSTNIAKVCVPVYLLVPQQYRHQKVQEYQKELPHEWTSCEGTRKHRQEAKTPPDTSADQGHSPVHPELHRYKEVHVYRYTLTITCMSYL